MNIGKYLLDLRCNLIRMQKGGFDPNPLKIPKTIYVSALSQIREEPFFDF